MKKILITGATGYIGSNLSRKFINDGTEVHALVLPDINFEYIYDIKHNLIFHIYDGTTESVFNALKKSEPDIGSFHPINAVLYQRLYGTCHLIIIISYVQ